MTLGKRRQVAPAEQYDAHVRLYEIDQYWRPRAEGAANEQRRKDLKNARRLLRRRLIRQAPQPAHIGSVVRKIFTPSDIDAITVAVGQTVQKGSNVKALTRDMNQAARECLVQGRLLEEGTPAAFERWSTRVSQAAVDLLAELGIEASRLPPAAFPMNAEAALLAGEEASFGVKPEDLGLPVDRRAALPVLARHVWYLHELAEQASAFHANRKKRAADRAKRDLSARQVFLLYLARTYECHFGQEVPRSPSSTSAFVKFAEWALETLVARMVKGAKKITSPRDGTDYRLASSLREGASASKIADDIRGKVYSQLKTRRRQSPHD